jgi:hypothetical protein
VRFNSFQQAARNAFNRKPLESTELNIAQRALGSGSGPGGSEVQILSPRPISLKINILRAVKTGMNPWHETRGSDSVPLVPIYIKELRSCRGGLGVIFVRGLTKGLTFFHSGLFGRPFTPIGATLNSVTLRPRPEVEAWASDLYQPRSRAF